MRIPVVYILSPGFSGSTLLTALLATHPDIGTIGERRYLAKDIRFDRAIDSICSCGKTVEQCPVLATAYEAGFSNLPDFYEQIDFTGLEFYKDRLAKFGRQAAMGDERGEGRSRFLWPLVRPRFKKVLAANARIMEHVLRTQNAVMFLDSSKSPYDIRMLHKSGLFDIHPVMLTRDGRAQVHSLMRRQPETPVEVFATRFVERIALNEEAFEALDRPPVRVYYEEVCSDPEKQLKSIVEQIGLDPGLVSVDFRRRDLHVIGNGAFVRSEAEEIVNEERWRSDMSKNDVKIFEEIAGSVNRELGYLN